MTKSKWINAKDQIPESSDSVLIAIPVADHYVLRVGYYSYSEQKWCICWKPETVADVHFWQPLPEAPNFEGSSKYEYGRSRSYSVF